MGISDVISSGVYYVVLPFLWFGRLLFSIFLFVLNPFIYLGQIALYVILIPYHTLAKFESLYYFLATAAIIGCCAGLFLFSLDRLLGNVLGISSDPPENGNRRGKRFQHGLSRGKQPPWGSTNLGRNPTATPSDPYPDKEKTPKLKTGDMSIDPRLSDFYAEWASSPDKGGMREGALFSTTILEEEDDNNDSDEW